MSDLKKCFDYNFCNNRLRGLESLPEFAQYVKGYSQNIGMYYMYFRIRQKDTKTAINICFDT